MQKNTSVFYYVFMLGAIGARAQQKPGNTQHVYSNSHRVQAKRNTKTYPGYVNINSGVGVNFTHNPPINLEVSFPYTTTLQGGAQQNEIFKAYKPNLSARNVMNYNFLSGKIGFRYVFAEFGFGELTTDGNSLSNFKADVYGNVGVGAMLPFGGVEKRFALQASVNWCGSSFGVPLGNIDNAGCTVSVMGLNSGPTFTYQVAHHQSKSTTYTNATGITTGLNVSMHQAQNFVCPKLTFCSNPLTHIFYWGATVAYYIPTKHTESLYFVQEGSSGQAASLGSVDFVSSAIKLQNNGNPVSTVPYNMRGFSIMLTIGVNIHMR